ncbi:MAG: hypothetical protein HWE30_03825 [Methylocystaceae bacterium]|nr:hypothetical protein [Methylocystaceae bacterium]
MVKIQSKEDFKAWMKGQPRTVAVGMAARFGLRLFTKLSVHQYEQISALILAAFRSVSVSWFAGTWPDHGQDIVSAAFEAADVAYDAVNTSGHDIDNGNVRHCSLRRMRRQRLQRRQRYYQRLRHRLHRNMVSIRC